jgi:hypothetical protein
VFHSKRRIAEGMNRRGSTIDHCRSWCKGRWAHPLYIHTYNNTSNAEATTWVKEDKMPNVGPFTGNPGVKQIPSDPTKVSEIIKLFFGDSFFEMLCRETKLYYFQNQGKYGSSSKGLKIVDVSVAEMKMFLQ